VEFLLTSFALWAQKEHIMQSNGVSAVTAYTAHREWATRPPDERYASVSALYDAARERRVRTEEREVETSRFCTEAESSDALVVREASGRTADLTNWSFEQLAAVAGAPAIAPSS
jgi:hypothetical protein